MFAERKEIPAPSPAKPCTIEFCSSGNFHPRSFSVDKAARYVESMKDADVVCKVHEAEFGN
ncbi:hypothetical protein [Neorhodopirellula lusitana]|uniref:hypothetical protein n=1 Tax=Neorhodopirellula lusitana TaxID=445327 RepID=UPI00384EC041